MIHPDTELKYISDEIGYGVFATARIPKGTIVFVKDPFDIELTPEEFLKLPTQYQEIADKYSYIDEHGVRILSWDHAKFVNHKCECNTMSSGYGFEIAIRDIDAGEEITDEYGLLNVEKEFPIACGCKNCRKMLRHDDIDNYYEVWDEKVKSSLSKIKQIKQPLWDYMDTETKKTLSDYLTGREPYRSVITLKYIENEQPVELVVRELNTKWDNIRKVVNL
jgi:uncharacterized protein